MGRSASWKRQMQLTIHCAGYSGRYSWLLAAEPDGSSLEMRYKIQTAMVVRTTAVALAAAMATQAHGQNQQPLQDQSLSTSQSGAPTASTHPGSAQKSPGQLRHDYAAAHALSYYPDKARNAGVEGLANLDCVLDEDGWPTHCVVVSETPANMDFGDAAIKMSPLFHFKPKDLTKPTEGIHMKFPIRFRLQSSPGK